jgi:SAM-dependent methyltransferase
LKLIDEYLNQQGWRNWESYLSKLPLSDTDRVVDLGCSVGQVSRLLAGRVKSVLGVDLNESFIDYCNNKKETNENYICGDITGLDFKSIGLIDGVWASFSLSYLSEPNKYIKALYSALNRNGWVAVVDVDCFLSGSLPAHSVYRERVLGFEKASYKSGVYDFSFGSKIEELLNEAGFTTIYSDQDVNDIELNSDTAAPNEVVDNWRARLNRLSGLKSHLSGTYEHFHNELVRHISTNERSKSGSVRYVVAQKI